MADKDVIGGFDYDQFSGAGLFLKFKADKPLVIRVLTTDPVISQTEFKRGDEVQLSTKFNYIVYNFTEGKAQILGATPTMSKKFGELHMDSDFGANIRNIDIKIYPTGEGLERRYDIQVLQKTNQLTAAQVQEAQAIALDDLVNDSRGRMSEWDSSAQKEPEVGSGGSAEKSGYEKAQEAAAKLKPSTTPQPEDVVIEDIGDEPINLDDIPF